LNHDRTQNYIQKLPTNRLLPAPTSTEDITPTVFAVLFIGIDAAIPTALEKQLRTGKYTLGRGGGPNAPAALAVLYTGPKLQLLRRPSEPERYPLRLTEWALVCNATAHWDIPFSRDQQNARDTDRTHSIKT
jgi:hypothetical protein